LGDTRFPPCFRELLMNQFLGLDTADHVLVNSFYDLEPQVSELPTQCAIAIANACIASCKMQMNARRR
jgi:hypothetical protein